MIKNCIYNILGGAILASGLYNIHSVCAITEGGILGLTMLLRHHFGISPACSGFVMNFLCYGLGLRVLGKSFIFYSAIAGGSFSLFYFLWEQFPPLLPAMGNYPFVAATLGAVFVGAGIGICVRAGGAPGGDDAFAMSVSHLSGMKIQWAYLFSDLSVLLLSLTYIPMSRLVYSFYTVILSGQIIGLFQKK